MGYSLLSKYRSELMGLAMIWVMLFHASNLDLGNPLLNLVRSAGFGGVDVFILLSALGLAASLNREERGFVPFMGRRARRILPAYFLVMVPYTLWCIGRGTAGFSTLVWNSLLLNYWVGAEHSFNWYVSGIMVFYAVTPFLFRRLKHSGHKLGLTAIWMALGVAVCHILLENAMWGYVDFFYRVPVFCLGLLMGFFVLEGRRIGKKDGVFWCAVTVLGLGYAAVALSVRDTSVHFPLCHLFLFTTVPMCLCACVLFEKLPLGWLRKGLRFLGDNSLEIYLLNVSVFSELELWQGLSGTRPPYRLYFFIAIIINIALGAVLHSLVEKMIHPRRPAYTES